VIPKDLGFINDNYREFSVGFVYICAEKQENLMNRERRGCRIDEIAKS